MSSGNTPYGSVNIYLDSKFAKVTKSDSNKTFFLKTPITTPREDIKLLVAMTDAQVARSWYLIRSGINNKFEYSVDGGAKTTITIPEGNYSVNSFVNTATTLLGGTKSLTYSKTTNKITFNDTGASSAIQVESGTTCNDEIGAGTDFPVVGAAVTSGFSVTMPNMSNFAGIPNVFVIARSFGLQNRDSEGAINLTLGKIPNTVAPLGFLYLPHSSPVYLAITDSSISQIQIILTDPDGNELDLHGVGWSITLTVHYEYVKYLKEYDGKHGEILPSPIEKPEIVEGD